MGFLQHGGYSKCMEIQLKIKNFTKQWKYEIHLIAFHGCPQGHEQTIK
jgi:hypothetical protein